MIPSLKKPQAPFPGLRLFAACIIINKKDRFYESE